MDLIGGAKGEESWRLFNHPRSVEYPRSKALELTGFREYSKKKKDPNKVYIKVNSFFPILRDMRADSTKSPWKKKKKKISA